MAVKIRLQVAGSTNHRKYRVVCVDESKPRNSPVIETLGFIDTEVKPFAVTLNKERVEHWKKLGAQVTPAVEKFTKIKV